MTDQSTSESSTEPTETTDPRMISAIVVTLADVVAALETALGTGRNAVLRITPPFSGRMRARLHIAGGEGSYTDPEPIHINPRSLIEPVPEYPTANETAATLDSEHEINTDSHETAHTERVAEWRASVRENVVTTAEIETPAGGIAVEVRWLGDDRSSQ